MISVGDVWRKEADPPPPLHRVQSLAPADREAMGGYREGMRVEASEIPLGQVALEGEGHRSSFEALK